MRDDAKYETKLREKIPVKFFPYIMAKISGTVFSYSKDINSETDEEVNSFEACFFFVRMQQ